MEDGLYFAYGSNLCAIQMRTRCPSSAAVGRALLPGHTLIFPRSSARRLCGVASIAAHPQGIVWGAVYRLTPADFAALDGHEGFDPARDPTVNAYNRVPVTVLRNGDPSDALQAVTYVAVPMAGSHRPNAEYRDTMLRGAHGHGLPPDYVGALECLEIQ